MECASCKLLHFINYQLRNVSPTMSVSFLLHLFESILLLHYSHKTFQFYLEIVAPHFHSIFLMQLDVYVQRLHTKSSGNQLKICNLFCLKLMPAHFIMVMNSMFNVKCIGAKKISNIIEHHKTVLYAE